MVALHTARLDVLDFVQALNHSTVDISGAFLFIQEALEVFFSLLILLLELVAHVFLLLEEFVVNLDIEGVPQQKRVSTGARAGSLKYFLVPLQHRLEFAHEAQALHLFQAA